MSVLAVRARATAVVLGVLALMALAAAGLLWPRPESVSANPLTDVGALAAGGFHTCAVTTGGGVKCWGTNFAGQLGDGSVDDRTTPVGVEGLQADVAAVAAGGSHTCVLTTDGGVKCWGANLRGQLGHETTELCFALSPCSTTPLDVTSLTGEVVAITAGGSHTCALMNDGSVKCWGANFHGQLGDGTVISRATPVEVAGLTGGVAMVSAGTHHTCALTTAEEVLCWGRNTSGRLGTETVELCFALEPCSTTPVAVSGLDGGVAASSAGGSHTCALTLEGGIKCWGANSSGQLGDGVTANRTEPADVQGLATGAEAIDAGGFHTCAVTTAGGVKCWGANDYGQLGAETIADCSGVPCSSTPIDVVGLTTGVMIVATGASHTCALTTGGRVKCWGHNGFGQLGDGTGSGGDEEPRFSNVPVDVVSVKPTAGDADCNGSINAIDAALILQLTADLVAVVPCQENADASGDGVVNAVDAALILQFTAGLLDSLPP